MSIHDYDPATLARVDAVDTIALDLSAAGARGSRMANEFIRSNPVRAAVRLTGAEAERIAALWRALPPGKNTGCHEPGYGLRFWLADQIQVEASLCWACHNAYGYVGDQAMSFTFD